MIYVELGGGSLKLLQSILAIDNVINYTGVCIIVFGYGIIIFHYKKGENRELCSCKP